MREFLMRMQTEARVIADCTDEVVKTAWDAVLVFLWPSLDSTTNLARWSFALQRAYTTYPYQFSVRSATLDARQSRTMSTRPRATRPDLNLWREVPRKMSTFARSWKRRPGKTEQSRRKIIDATSNLCHNADPSCASKIGALPTGRTPRAIKNVL